MAALIDWMQAERLRLLADGCMLEARAVARCIERARKLAKPTRPAAE